MFSMIISFLVALTICGSYGNPIECPINEHPTDCVNACPTPTCSDPRPPSCNFLVCNKGCECDEGYVRTKKPDGPCIPISRCKNCLRPGFAFNDCGSNCSTTCRYVTENLICPLVCTPGCYCAGGKVLDEASNKCVDKKQCIKSTIKPCD
ncbi:von Willebrand factor-like [Coccinella septempunctata]|uniref:von Willebrand factor-like n=1 Tax=Coccinella septempunctata TaxID=41139 RepID=UPI001D07E1D9|nr:von Willebrand factor-like [Coccinella septempunctata]